MHAAAEHELVGSNPEPEAGPPLALTDREPEVEVVLVGALVAGEARVSRDPEDGAVDARVGVDIRHRGPQLLAHGDHEVARRLEQQVFVLGAVGVEPLARVVLPQARQEIERAAIEPLEAHAATTETDLAPSAPASRSASVASSFLRAAGSLRNGSTVISSVPFRTACFHTPTGLPPTSTTGEIHPAVRDTRGRNSGSTSASRGKKPTV